MELAEKRMRGEEVETTNRTNCMRIFVVNGGGVTECFNFSRSELLRLECKTNGVRHKYQGNGGDGESEGLEKWVRTGRIQSTGKGFSF